jgi:hypothetical protein
MAGLDCFRTKNRPEVGLAKGWPIYPPCPMAVPEGVVQFFLLIKIRANESHALLLRHARVVISGIRKHSVFVGQFPETVMEKKVSNGLWRDIAVVSGVSRHDVSQDMHGDANRGSVSGRKVQAVQDKV